MGGRGGSYSRSVSARSQRDFQSLADYMKNEHSVRVAPELAKADFSAVREAAAGMEELLREFPQAASIIRELNGKECRKSAYASASFNGLVQLNPDRWKDRGDLERSYQADVKSGFHPAGNASSIAVHEVGHLLERALISKAGLSRYDSIIAWNKNKQATRVISEAAKAAKKGAGKGMTNDQLVAQVSRYATKNRSEALAECVADYRSNGANAKPLSREVWKILKRELG